MTTEGRVIYGPLLALEPQVDLEQIGLVQGEYPYDPNAITLEEILEAERWAAEVYRKMGRVPRCDWLKQGDPIFPGVSEIP